MNHEAYVRFVDAHAECIGRNDHPRLAADPVLLFEAAGQVTHATVVAVGFDPVFLQEFGDGLGLFPRADINDPATRYVVHDTQQVFALVFGAAYHVGEIRPRKAHLFEVRLAKAQVLHDVGRHFRRRRSSQREDRRFGLQVAQPRDLQVGGPEVVPPLRNAVRLVHGDQRNFHLREAHPKQFAVDPFGGDIEKLHVAVNAVVEDAVDLLPPASSMDRLGQDPAAAQPVDLVFHQRNERRDNDAYSFGRKRRYLVDDRLAAAGGHQHERVTPRGDRFDCLELQRSERVVSPVFFQDCGVVARKRRMWHSPVVWANAIWLEYPRFGRS